MSELMSEMDRAAAAYWRDVARLGAGDASAALATAQTLVVEARAESRIVESSQTPTLNQIEVPPLGLRR
ncbi:MAG: hypothetical protein M0T84_05045 [Betaproteobacteria bacterium]|nr:hypothetical protein [Betaproteobacteria bacterium]